MQGMACKHLISMNQSRPPSSEELKIAVKVRNQRPLRGHSAQTLSPTFIGHSGASSNFCTISFLSCQATMDVAVFKSWNDGNPQNLDSSVPCTSHIGKVDDGWCILALARQNHSKRVHVHSRSQPSVTSCIWSSTTCIAGHTKMPCDAKHYCSANMWKRWYTPELLTMKIHETKIRGSLPRFESPLSRVNLQIHEWSLFDFYEVLHLGIFPMPEYCAWPYALALRWHPSWAPKSCWTCPVCWSHLYYIAIYIYIHDMYLCVCAYI